MRPIPAVFFGLNKQSGFRLAVFGSTAAFHLSEAELFRYLDLYRGARQTFLRDGRVGCLLGLPVGLNDGFIASIGGGGSPRAQILELFDFLLSEMLDANEHVLAATCANRTRQAWLEWRLRRDFACFG